ncbi:MAG: hypothetical protein IPM77_15065 [Crocinitomicaceae bacterium]|nr:hypothetical protein [Crocinitomicaceae bacterium]
MTHDFDIPEPIGSKSEEQKSIEPVSSIAIKQTEKPEIKQTWFSNWYDSTHPSNIWLITTIIALVGVIITWFSMHYSEVKTNPDGSAMSPLETITNKTISDSAIAGNKEIELQEVIIPDSMSFVKIMSDQVYENRSITHDASGLIVGNVRLGISNADMKITSGPES